LPAPVKRESPTVWQTHKPREYQPRQWLASPLPRDNHYYNNHAERQHSTSNAPVPKFIEELRELVNYLR